MKRLATWLLGCVVLMCMVACGGDGDDYDEAYWTSVYHTWEEVQCDGKVPTHPRTFYFDYANKTMRLRFPYMPDALGEMEYANLNFEATVLRNQAIRLFNDENDLYGRIVVKAVTSKNIEFKMTVWRHYANTKWDEFEFVCKLKKD